MKDQRGKPLKATWKLLKANQLEVEVPLKDESAGPVLTLVGQSGLSKPDEVPPANVFRGRTPGPLRLERR
jgi:hypothetical protein